LPTELIFLCGEVMKMFSYQFILSSVSDTASLEIFFDLPIDDVFNCLEVVDSDGNRDRSSMLELGSPERQKHTPLIDLVCQRWVMPFGKPQLFSLLDSHVILLLTFYPPTSQPLHKDFGLPLTNRRRQRIWSVAHSLQVKSTLWTLLSTLWLWTLWRTLSLWLSTLSTLSLWLWWALLSTLSTLSTLWTLSTTLWLWRALSTTLSRLWRPERPTLQLLLVLPNEVAYFLVATGMAFILRRVASGIPKPCLQLLEGKGGKRTFRGRGRVQVDYLRPENTFMTRDPGLNQALEPNQRRSAPLPRHPVEVRRAIPVGFVQLVSHAQPSQLCLRLLSRREGSAGRLHARRSHPSGETALMKGLPAPNELRPLSVGDGLCGGGPGQGCGRLRFAHGLLLHRGRALLLRRRRDLVLGRVGGQHVLGRVPVLVRVLHVRAGNVEALDEVDVGAPHLVVRSAVEPLDF
jgi:hypothetical protein